MVIYKFNSIDLLPCTIFQTPMPGTTGHQVKPDYRLHGRSWNNNIITASIVNRVLVLPRAYNIKLNQFLWRSCSWQQSEVLRRCYDGVLRWLSSHRQLQSVCATDQWVNERGFLDDVAYAGAEQRGGCRTLIRRQQQWLRRWYRHRPCLRWNLVARCPSEYTSSFNISMHTEERFIFF